MELLKIVLGVGCPYILQCNNGREITTAIIQKLTSERQRCKIVNGKSRYPASQGHVMLLAWLIDNHTKNVQNFF